MKSERFKRNYRNSERYDILFERMWNRNGYNSWNSQYDENGRRSGRDNSVLADNTKGNIYGEYARSGRTGISKSIADNAEQKSRVIYTIGWLIDTSKHKCD